MDVISSSIEATKKILLLPLTFTKKGIQIYAGLKRFERFTEPKSKSGRVKQAVEKNNVKGKTVVTAKSKEDNKEEKVNLKEVISEYKNKNEILQVKKEEMLKYKAERVQNVKENSLDKGGKTQRVNYKDFYEKRGKSRGLEKEYDREIER